MTLAELRQAYRRGDIARDDFWLRAQQEYRRLRANAPVPDGGAVARLHDGPEGLVVELRDGLRLRWDIEDLRTAPNMLLNHGEYEAHELAVLLDAARDAHVIFDIGANIGWYTLHLARALAAHDGTRRVYAFEPIPRTFQVLTDNVRLNGLERHAVLTNVGLGDEAKTVEFFLPRQTGSVAASQRPLFAQQDNERITARIERLDDFVAAQALSRLDLIKCDIEGAELFMLRGALASIERFRPVIFLELLRKWSKAYGYHPNDVIGLLAPLGYRCLAIGSAGAPLEPIAAIDDATVATNFLFVPGDGR